MGPATAADDTNDLDSSTINDPLYACQWHLNSGDSAGMDINVESVWADRHNGRGCERRRGGLHDRP